VIPNPLARRRRLAAELRRLREQSGYSHAQLAALARVSTAVISRLETPLSDMSRRPNTQLVTQLLDALGVGPEWEILQRHAGVAAGGGWWDAPQYARMGEGQRDYATVEAGAAEILEYAGLLLPGLVQTADLVRHWARFDADTDVEAVVAGRMERQRRAADVPYRLVLEEQAIRRGHGLPAQVMRGQLDHLLELAKQPNISLRVLPVGAQMAGPAPRGTYAVMTYPDSEDPPIVIVDGGVKRSTLHTETAGYAQSHERLWSAAVSEDDTTALIREVAESLAI
jgi:transcriptional regulator with XRE-family HTH domain